MSSMPPREYPECSPVLTTVMSPSMESPYTGLQAESKAASPEDLYEQLIPEQLASCSLRLTELATYIQMVRQEKAPFLKEFKVSRQDGQTR